MKDKAEILEARRNLDHKQIMLKEKQKELVAKVAALKAQYKAEENELEKNIEQAQQNIGIMAKDRKMLASVRKTD